jgi:hypothetical protein
MKIWNPDHTISSDFTVRRLKSLYININNSNVVARKIIVLLFWHGFRFYNSQVGWKGFKNQTTERTLSREIFILIPAEAKSGGAYGK